MIAAGAASRRAAATTRGPQQRRTRTAASSRTVARETSSRWGRVPLLPAFGADAGRQREQREPPARQPEQAAAAAAGSGSSRQRHQQAAAPPGDYAALLAVSLLWGCYTPTLRWLFTLDDALTPQVLTAHRTVISATALLVASAVSIAYERHRQHQQRVAELVQRREQALQQAREAEARPWRRLLPTLLLNMLAPLGNSTTSEKRGLFEQQQSSSGSSSSSDGAGPFGLPLSFFRPRADGAASVESSGGDASASGSSSSPVPLAAVLAAGLELGLWNFCATAAQACGLELSTATKAAFLTQTTAVFTPCLAMLCGQAVQPAHWLACLAALVGSCCITLDSMAPSLAGGGGSLAAGAAATEVAAPAAVPAPATPAGMGVGLDTEQQQGLADAPLTVAAELSSSGSSSGSDAAAGLAGFEPLQVLAAPPLASDGSALAAGSSGPSDEGGVLGASDAPEQAQVQPQQALLLTEAADASDLVAASDGSGVPVAALSVPDAALAQPGVLAAAEADAAGGGARGEAAAAAPPPSVQQLDAAQALAPSAPSAAAAAGAAGSPAAAASGEVFILAACACYAIATVRLSMLAPGIDPVQLATSKTLTLAAASLLWLLAVDLGADGGAAAGAAAGGGGGSAGDLAGALQAAAAAWQLPAAFQAGPGMALLLFSALGPGALATVLQAQGQSTVAAAQAQVFYSLTPVWAALLASSCLQGEEMGPLAWLGGGIIVAASVGAAVSGAAPLGADPDDGGRGADSSFSGQ